MGVSREDAYKQLLIAIADTMEDENTMLKTAYNIRKAIMTIEENTGA